MGDEALLVIDAPADLNRLWFVGAVLGCAPRVKERASGHAVDGLRRAAGALHLTGEGQTTVITQWRALWQSSLEAGPAHAPLAPTDLNAVLQALDDAFHGWWSPPAGARFALEWWIERIQLAPADAARLANGDHPVRIDVVGLGDRIERRGTYRRIGADNLLRLAGGTRFAEVVLA